LVAKTPTTQTNKGRTLTSFYIADKVGLARTKWYQIMKQHHNVTDTKTKVDEDDDTQCNIALKLTLK